MTQVDTREDYREREPRPEGRSLEGEVSPAGTDSTEAADPGEGSKAAQEATDGRRLPATKKACGPSLRG